MHAGFKLTLDNVAHHVARMEQLLEAGDQAAAREAFEQAQGEAGVLGKMLETIGDTFFARKGS